MRAELCRLGGRLGDTPEDCAAVLKRMRENPASDPAPLLVKMLTSRSDAPAAHDLAPGLGQRLDDGLRRDRDLPTRPLPPLQIPAKFLKAARA
jgi:hypothetical protein